MRMGRYVAMRKREEGAGRREEEDGGEREEGEGTYESS
jgi:hypothetical protein